MSDNDEAKVIYQAVQKANTFSSKVGFCAIGLIVGLVLGIAGALFFSHYNPPDEKKGIEILEASVVFERVKSQNEMVSASQRYNITEKAGDTNKIPFTDIEIPFTGNSFWYKYVGELKVGVNLKTAEFKQDGNTIMITLDQPYISSNTPDMEQSRVLEESNNILNPIHVDDVKAFQDGCVELSQERALEGGIIEEARANAEQNIKNMFNAALGDDYTVVIDWR